ncbi:MAG: endonuclease/exonuclease/phosphatase family protein [Planctomycetales bacterium]|nr:endonuclease/exonuclease/phosphatase family protein [Planctomycetales bacterium]
MSPPATARAWILLSAMALIAPALIAGNLPRAVAQERERDKLIVASWNLEWFYDDHPGDNYTELAKEQSAPSAEAWAWKRDTVAAAIAKMKPDLLALQEIENQQVLYYLTQRLKSNHGLSYRIAYVQGHDYFTEQDVAVLYRQDAIEVGRWEGTLEDARNQSLSSVNKHMFAKFYVGQGEQRQVLTLVNLHLRARAEQAERRARQARQLNVWLRRLPPEQRQRLIVLGDFNTEHQFGATVATPSELDVLRSGETENDADDLLDLHQWIAADARATHLSGGQFDRLLVSPALARREAAESGPVLESVRVGKEFCVRGTPDRSHWEQSAYWTIPNDERDVSDHYPLIATFRFR